MDFFKKYLKWISTAFVLSGILLTNLNYYPLNIFLHGMGALGWTLAGYLNQDRAYAEVYAQDDNKEKFIKDFIS